MQSRAENIILNLVLSLFHVLIYSFNITLMLEYSKWLRQAFRKDRKVFTVTEGWLKDERCIISCQMGEEDVSRSS